MKRFAVLTHSLSMARIWLEVDHKARMTHVDKGIFPSGDHFQIFYRVERLRGTGTFDDYMEGPPVPITPKQLLELREMRQIIECQVERK